MNVLMVIGCGLVFVGICERGRAYEMVDVVRAYILMLLGVGAVLGGLFLPVT